MERPARFHDPGRHGTRAPGRGHLPHHRGLDTDDQPTREDRGSGEPQTEARPVADDEHTLPGNQAGLLDRPLLLLGVAVRHQRATEASDEASRMAEARVQQAHQ